MCRIENTSKSFVTALKETELITPPSKFLHVVVKLREYQACNKKHPKAVWRLVSNDHLHLATK